MSDRIRVGSLCSGYEGIGLGLKLVFGEVSHEWLVEYDAAPSKILAHRFPGVPNHGDVKHTDWTQVAPVDLLTAGYPCQPFSAAGLRKGADDPRHLWPGVERAISVLRPGLVLLENVRGHVSLGLDAVLGDLAALGYDATWGVVRAADAGAPHSRARIFILATAQHPHGGGREPRGLTGVGRPLGGWGSDPRVPAAATHSGADAAPDADGERHERCGSAWGRGAGSADDRGRNALDGDASLRVVEGGNDSHDEGAGASPRAQRPAGRGRGASAHAAVAWGAYAPAIARWEHVTGRHAPRPTEPGRSGERLSPRFVEWMMGLPAGWVTDVPGLPRNAQLKALGNGVVPQQTALALRLLLPQAVAA